MKLLTILSIALLSLSLVKTDSNEDIWTKQSHVKEIIAYESQLDPYSKFIDHNISLSLNSIPELKKYKVTKPIIVQRQTTEYLPLYTHYYFTESDSIVRYISYNWELELYGNLFKKIELFKKEKDKIKIYNKEYKRIKKDLIKKFGKPKSEDSTPKETSSKNDDEIYLSRLTEWENDKYYSKLSLIFASAAYKIEMTYYWK
jgi:hypothetical protein